MIGGSVRLRREETLANIARSMLGFTTLATRKSDGADFREVAVWQVKSALEAAYEAGIRSVIGTPKPKKEEVK